ncbi:Sec-independent protein translocase TatB [Corynebacterium tapiri]|uniref:Sec-independent protein translocase protein TatB n=1 Tax=Corynebacterium tapiri TaxID=1448266 RepID=A0A5C4U601_9CORY|nr:Sec-independent protein translocase TatB [Corynebacterium tapiri]TNL99678.1 Sec-independent protein translocase TatB [Corynebacterium tapiri]
MFDNIGWVEIAVLVIVAVIVVGPERLPGLLKDVRAAIYAARKGIANARAELDGTFGDEFAEFREPIAQAAEWGRLGPKRAITRALFDGDDSALDDFDPRRILAETGIDPTRETPAQAARRLRKQADALEQAERAQGSTAASAGPADPAGNTGYNPQNPPKPQKAQFSWEDVL